MFWKTTSRSMPVRPDRSSSRSRIVRGGVIAGLLALLGWLVRRFLAKRRISSTHPANLSPRRKPARVTKRARVKTVRPVRSRSAETDGAKES